MLHQLDPEEFGALQRTFNNEGALIISHGVTLRGSGRRRQHWWKNNGSVPAVLNSADILPPEMDDHDTM
nr:hypothetical protein [Mesorhizobium alhagi]